MTIATDEFVEGKGVLKEINGQGDVRTTWDPDKPAEVAAARKVFDRLKKDEKYLAYDVKPDGSPGEVIQEFNPQARAIIMRPQVKGG